MQRARKTWLWFIPIVLFGVAYVDHEQARATGDWRRASREPLGLAPDPVVTRDAVVQVYAARAVRWRGYFGVHTWIAAKRSGADGYTVYEVNGWRRWRTGTSVAIGDRPPDSPWFGSTPRLIAQRSGAGVDDVIDRIEAAVRDYPYAGDYRVWPGPNSNTFTAFVLRAAPELRADLPATAIGKDYLGWNLFAKAPSGTGAQFNVLGVLGVLIGVEEGLEVNLLGLTFGVDPLGLALKLPLAGSIGWPQE